MHLFHLKKLGKIEVALAKAVKFVNYVSDLFSQTFLGFSVNSPTSRHFSDPLCFLSFALVCTTYMYIPRHIHVNIDIDTNACMGVFF